MSPAAEVEHFINLSEVVVTGRKNIIHHQRGEAPRVNMQKNAGDHWYVKYWAGGKSLAIKMGALSFKNIIRLKNGSPIRRKEMASEGREGKGGEGDQAEEAG